MGSRIIRKEGMLGHSRSILAADTESAVPRVCQIGAGYECMRTIARQTCVIGCFLAALAAAPAFSQVLVGQVLDAMTGEVLSASTVQIEGTYRGTIANADGRFELLVDALPAAVIIRHIGYSTRRIELQFVPQAEVSIALEPVSISLQELVVTDEDPAVRIMREVIERKKKWRASLESTKAIAYSRYTISNDTGIVFIRESVSDAYWDHESGSREVVTGSRQTEGFDMGLAVPAAESVVNLYDDNIPAFGYEFIGVTHPQALSYYRFHLVGTLHVDDIDIYEIEVAPRNKFISAFKGRVFVHGREYGLMEAELEPGESVYMPPPVQSFNTVYKQQFSTYGGQYWLPVDYRFEATLDIGLSVLLKVPPIKAAQVSRFTDYEINTEVPAEVYADEAIIQVDSAAVEADSVLTREGVAVPLLSAERKAYAEIDSTFQLEDAFKPRGPASFMFRAMGNLSDATERDSVAGGLLPSWLNVSPRLWYNSVDAFAGTARIRIGTPDNLTLRGSVGRSIGQQGRDAWQYRVYGRLEIGDDHNIGMDAAYSAGTEFRYTSRHMHRWRTSVHMLFGNGDYHDYYRNQGIRVGADASMLDGAVEARTDLRLEQHSPLVRATTWDLWGTDEDLRINPLIGPARFQSVSASLVVGGFRSFSGAGAGRFVKLEVEQSLPSSAYDYTRYHIQAEWRQETLVPRRLLPAMLHLRLDAAASSGTLPLQRMHIVEGAISTSRVFGLLHSHDGLPFVGDAILAFYWDHNFRSLPFEFFGLRALARRGYGATVFGGHARTWSPAGQRGTKGYHEVGAGLTGILGFLRVNVVKHLGGGVNVTYGLTQIF